MFKKFVKRPIVVNAVKYDGTNGNEIVQYANEMLQFQSYTTEECYVDDKTNNLYVQSMEGTMRALVGDYIIQGPFGEFYPCKPDIFDATYSEIDEDNSTELNN